MNLFRTLTQEEKNIKYLLKNTRKIIKFKESQKIYDKNLSFLNSQIENYSGKYKKRFSEKLDNIKRELRWSLNYLGSHYL